MPGFPVPRALAAAGVPSADGTVALTRSLTRSGDTVSLLSFGPSVDGDCGCSGLSLADRQAIARRMAASIGRSREQRLALLRRRVHKEA